MVLAKPATAAADTLLELAAGRRSIYALTKTLPISTQRLRHLVEQITLHTPSSFNTQTNRAVVLLGDHHEKLWKTVVPSAIKATGMPADALARTESRLAGFVPGAGTVLFFDDHAAIDETKERLPMIKDVLSTWAVQSNAMQQWITWTALEAEGLGANLQHYNQELVNQAVQEEWGLPKGWKLNAQLIFGGRGAEAAEKEFKPLEERLKIFE